MQTKTLSVALGVLVACFVGFAWWVFLSSEGKMHWSVPVLCTIGPLALALTVLLVQSVMARKAASGLELALVAEGARQQQRAGTQRSAEVERLRREFERAVGALKSSKLAKGQGNAKNALYRLPWYTIIGPPACGKTTVLANSGLKFPHLAGTGERLKGIGGTRNCDWWLTNHAILLDTAGRWTVAEADDDRDEWFAFLDLLKTHRRERPLNGVIAAISIAGDPDTSLSGQDIQGVKRLAAQMRERLDEVTGRLGVSLPVYLMFTKCDLIAGFVETFGEMGPEERRQIWGFTAPLLSGPVDSPGAYFGENFESLCGSLEQHALRRMGSEVQPDVIAKIYEFPAQVRSLEEKLCAFVEELFEGSEFGETPILRGAYFTSGTQEGAPADFLMEDMAASLNLRPLQQETVADKKSYFLHDMLMDVVFEDRNLATVSQAELLRRQQIRRRWTTGLFVGAALVPTVSSVSCQLNLDSLEQTREALKRVSEDAAPDANALVPGPTEPLVGMDDEVARYEAGMPSLMAGFGFYQGDDLREPLVEYYGAALKEWVIRPILNKNNEKLITITQQIEGLRRQHAEITLDETSRVELLNSLKMHLLLTAPREKCIPKPFARKDWIVRRSLELWGQGAPTKDKTEVARRQALLTRYLELHSAQEGEEDDGSKNVLAMGRDERRVELARQALGGDDGASQLLNGVLEQFGKEQQDLTRLVGASTVLSGSATIHGAFTLDVWRQISRELGSVSTWGATSENWVLGCDQKDAQEKRAAQNSDAFQREYTKRYAEQWRQFLKGITAQRPPSLAVAETMLSELIGRPGVLGTLFQRVKEATDLPAPAASKPVAAVTDTLKQAAAQKLAALPGAGAALDQALAAPPNPATEGLKAAFSGFVSFGVSGTQGGDPPLEQYRRQVEPVLMALKAYRSDASKLEALATAAQNAVSAAEMLLSSHGGEWNAELNAILIPPLRAISELTVGDQQGRLQRRWCEAVYRPYQEKLATRFPMQRDAEAAASLAEFAEFFQPNSGLIWAFQSGQLSGLVVAEGDRFRFGSQNGVEGSSVLSGELISFLNRAAEVKQAFFAGGSQSIRVPFRMRVRGGAGFSVTTFTVGTKSVRYDSGAEVWASADWPGENPSIGASLTAQPYQGAAKTLTKSGDWGLFAIIGKARLESGGDRQFTANWTPKGSPHSVKVDFAADDPRSPILTVPFGKLLPLKVPAAITRGGGGC